MSSNMFFFGLLRRSTYGDEQSKFNPLYMRHEPRGSGFMLRSNFIHVHWPVKEPIYSTYKIIQFFFLIKFIFFNLRVRTLMKEDVPSRAKLPLVNYITHL
jgi:hypothetical protein